MKVQFASRAVIWTAGLGPPPANFLFFGGPYIGEWIFIELDTALGMYSRLLTKYTSFVPWLFDSYQGFLPDLGNDIWYDISAQFQIPHLHSVKVHA